MRDKGVMRSIFSGWSVRSHRSFFAYAKTNDCMVAWDAMSIRLNSKNKFKVEITVGGQNVAFRENAGPFVFTHRQDYFVAPDQEWVDGTAVSDDKVRQFVVINPGTG